MSDIDLDEIDRALAERTPGDWRVDTVRTPAGHLAVSAWNADEVPCVVCDTHGHCSSAADAHLIAHAPEWLRVLVARVRELEADVADAKRDERERIVALLRGEAATCDRVAQSLGATDACREIDELRGAATCALQFANELERT